MKRKPYESPVAPEDEFQPLAVLRLHWKKIFFASAGVILLIWGVAVIGGAIASRAGRWVTEHAEFTQEGVALGAEALFVREEMLLDENADGTVVPQIQAGESVGKGKSYALVCANGEDAEALSRKNALEQRLVWLQEAARAQHFHALNAEQISNQVDSTFASILEDIDRSAFGNMNEWKELFLHRSTTMDAVLGRPVDLSGKIAEVQKELNQLQARAIPTTESLAPKSGSYYPMTDGLEGRLTPKRLLSGDSAKHFAQLWAEQEKAGTQAAQTRGKLVTDFTWYTVAKLSADKAQQLQEGSWYTVVFPQESAREFKMQVRTIRREGADDAFVVLSCDEKDDNIQCLRTAKAEIILRSVDGLVFPSAALRFLEVGEGPQSRQATGVFVIRAGKALWREVQVLYDDRSRVVVAWGGLNEARAAEGDRITVSGDIKSVTKQEDGKLLLTGRDMMIIGENTNVQPAIPGGPTTVVAMRRQLFDSTLISGKNLEAVREGEVLVLKGENISYREQRGEGLKIHDAVLVEGKVPT